MSPQWFSRASAVAAAVLAVPTLTAADLLPTFVRGDANGDGRTDLSDAVRILAVLFRGRESLACADAADLDDNGQVEISDSIFLLRNLFQGGPPLPAPFPQAGWDPTVDALSCLRQEDEPPLAENAERLGIWTALEPETLFHVRGGIRVSQELFDALTAFSSGQPLEELGATLEGASLLEQLAELRAAPRSPLVRPRRLRLPAGPDGCVRIDPQLLAGGSRSFSGTPADRLKLSVEPERVCGVGRHAVQLTVEDTAGRRSSAPALVMVCNPRSDDCVLEMSDPPPDRLPDDAGAVRCVWYYTVDNHPIVAEEDFRAVLRDPGGRAVEIFNRQPLPRRAMEGPLNIARRENPSGPHHSVLRVRRKARCSTPKDEGTVEALGSTLLRLNLLCFDPDLHLIRFPCEKEAEAEASYRGVCIVDTDSGPLCSSVPQAVEVISHEETEFVVQGRQVFAKALTLQRGTKVNLQVGLTFGAGVGLSDDRIAGQVQFRFGRSHTRIRSVGPAEGALEALGGDCGSLPFDAWLAGRGVVASEGEGASSVFAGAATQAAALYALGVTTCPTDQPFFAVAIAHAIRREEVFDDLMRRMQSFFRSRTGRELDITEPAKKPR